MGDSARRRDLDDRRPGRSGRARSRSPGYGRYQPYGRNRDDNFYPRGPQRDRDDRRRGGSPPIDRYIPGQPPQPVVRTNPMPNPISLDFQVGFNFFAEWWRVEQAIIEHKEYAKDPSKRPAAGAVKGENEAKEQRDKERAQIQTAYDAYKDELQIKMSRLFVQQHKDEEWFKERYIPTVRDPIRRQLVEYRQNALSQWLTDIDAGSFDDFTLEGIYKADSDGQGGVIDREEGETVAANEHLGVGDLVASKGGDIQDGAVQQPALLIKTLAPMVSRRRIEELCREHLGEGDGGFKWLSLSDPNPQKKCHRIGWILLNPSSETQTNGDRSDGRDEEGHHGMDTDSRVPLGAAERAVEAINGKTIEDEAKGNFTCHVGVHSTPREPKKKALWDLFSAPERIERDLELAKRIVVKFDAELSPSATGVAKIEERVENLRMQGLLQTSVGSSSASKANGHDDNMEDGEEAEPDDDADTEDLLVKKKTLDLLVEYLRRVFNFCFFCVFESDSVHELVRKCPGGHLRRPRAALGTLAKRAATASAQGQVFPIDDDKKEEAAEEGEEENGQETEKPTKKARSKTEQQLLRAFNWVRTYEDKLLQILEPENINLKKLGGSPIEEGSDEELRKFVKQEDENKFRCKVPDCTKLFKGEVFWRKHVEKRHEDIYEQIRANLALVNAYVSDPAHIAPSRTDASSNGHFPTGNQNNSAGTPRGFNLQNMQVVNGMMPFSPPGAFPPMPSLGGHQVQAYFNPAFMGNGDSGHAAGPMRRGGRYGGNPRSGPYDRRGGRMGSNPMLMSGPGMGTGPMNNRRFGPPGQLNGAGRWGDGAGAQAMGPKEAVQGRTIKRYDDLDAVGGGGGGALNY